MAAFEWHNEAQLGGGTPLASGISYLAGRKGASTLIKTCWGTSTSDSVVGRDSYNASWDLAHTTNIDAYVPIHNNTYIGADGAYSNTTYFADGVHPNSTGAAILATLMATGLSTL